MTLVGSQRHKKKKLIPVISWDFIIIIIIIIIIIVITESVVFCKWTKTKPTLSPVLSHQHNARVRETALLMIDASEHDVGLSAVLPL